MAEDILPTQQPAFLGEWTYNATTTPPPATGTLRTNAAKATSIFVNNISFNGINASAWLMEMKTGYVIRFEGKNDPTIWQTYSISSDPIAQSGYVQLNATWIASGKPLVGQTMVSVVTCVVRPTGNAITASVGSPTASIATRVPVQATPCMKVNVSPVEITGQLVTREFAYPFQGIHYTSPGMTIRQYYVGQAITGFLASGGPIANLIGKGAELCFKVADSMIAFEKNEGKSKPVTVGPPPTAPITVTPEEVAAMQEQEKAPLN